MKKTTALLIALMIAVFSILSAFFLYFFNDSQPFHHNALSSHQLLALPDRSLITAEFNGQQFLFELVNSNASRTLGLSGRDHIGSDGMLFVFERKALHQIWMKEMRFDLDIIWLSEGQVVDLTQAVPKPLLDQPNFALPIYQPQQTVNMVLEVESGFVDQHKITIEDEFLFLQSKTKPFRSEAP